MIFLLLKRHDQSNPRFQFRIPDRLLGIIQFFSVVCVTQYIAQPKDLCKYLINHFNFTHTNMKRNFPCCVLHCGDVLPWLSAAVVRTPMNCVHGGHADPLAHVWRETNYWYISEGAFVIYEMRCVRHLVVVVLCFAGVAGVADVAGGADATYLHI